MPISLCRLVSGKTIQSLRHTGNPTQPASTQHNPSLLATMTPVPTEPNKVSSTPTKSDALDTQERGIPEVERTGVDERGAGPSHSCRAPPAGPPRVHSRQVPKDPRVHMDPALAATKCSYHITWKLTRRGRLERHPGPDWATRLRKRAPRGPKTATEPSWLP